MEAPGALKQGSAENEIDPNLSSGSSCRGTRSRGRDSTGAQLLAFCAREDQAHQQQSLVQGTSIPFYPIFDLHMKGLRFR